MNEIVSPEQWTCAIVQCLMETITATKLFHWATTNFASHQSSGVLADSLFAKMDALVEAMLSKGQKSGLRTCKVAVQTSFDSFPKALHNLQVMLRGFDDPMCPFARESQILNLRDDLLSSIDSFFYLEKQFG